VNDTSPSSTPVAALIIPGLLCLYLLATSAFDLLPPLGTFNGKRILETVLLAAMSLVALSSAPLREQAGRYWTGLPGWTRWLMGGALGLGLVSALRQPLPGYGLAEVALLALMCLAITMVAASRRLAGQRFDRLVLVSIAALGGIVATTEMAGFQSGWAHGMEFRYEEMLIRFAHPRFYNQLQTWSLPLLAALPLLFPTRRWLKPATVVLLGLQWFLLFATGARGSIVSLAAGFTMLALLASAGRAAWMRTHATGLWAGLAIYLAVLLAHGQFAPGGGEFVEQSVGRPLFHTTGRTLMWQAAWRDAFDHPVLGVGPSRFVCGESPHFASHPHNYPLTLLAEWGFPATLMLLAVVGWLAWALLRSLSRQLDHMPERAVLLGMLAAGVMAAAVHANVSGILIMPASQVTAVLVCGWLIGALGKGRNAAAAGRGTALCLTALLASLALTAFSAKELGQMEHRLRDYDRERASPRFWQYGRVCDYSGSKAPVD